MRKHVQLLPVADPDSLRMAAEVIRSGGIVAFPTETVYGLGADAFNSQAIARIFEVKNRPTFDPLIVHIADLAALDRLVENVPPWAQRLIDQFWPGPLTLVLPKRTEVPDLVTAGLPTVAVRMPTHPSAQMLIREAGTPIAAPSANPFGYVSPTCAQHVLDGLGNRVDLILDGGPCPIGVESTIVSMGETWPELLRPGSITLAEIRDVIGPVLCGAAGQAVVAPGQLPRHYATHTPLSILPVPGTFPEVSVEDRAGLFAFSTLAHLEGYCAVEVLSPSGDLRVAAQNLFAALRRLDALGLDHLYVEPCEEQGLGVTSWIGSGDAGTEDDPACLKATRNTAPKCAGQD